MLKADKWLRRSRGFLMTDGKVQSKGQIHGRQVAKRTVPKSHC